MSRHSHLTPFFPNSPIHSGFPFSPRAAPYVVGSLEHLAYARATIQRIKRLAGPITFLVYRIWNKGQKVLKTLLIHSYSFFNIFFPTFPSFLSQVRNVWRKNVTLPIIFLNLYRPFSLKMKDLSNVYSAKKVTPDTRCSRETKRNGFARIGKKEKD